MVVAVDKVKLTPAQESFLIMVVKFFLARGWAIWKPFGVASNIYAECSFNPAVVGDGGKARGICQWHPDRQRNFFKVFGQALTAMTPVELQLKFILWELANTEKRAGVLISGARTAYEVGSIFSRHYERPLKADAEATARGELAQMFFERYASRVG